jgi:hypothetical protein
MNDYLVMILGSVAAHAQITPAEMQKLIAGHAEFGKGLRASGIYRDGERLRPEAKRVQGKDVFDGPFAETKEALGGYYVVRAESLGQRRRSRNAVRCSTVTRSKCAGNERRAAAREDGQAGQVFGCRRRRQQLMDRVDAETSRSSATMMRRFSAACVWKRLAGVCCRARATPRDQAPSLRPRGDRRPLLPAIAQHRRRRAICARFEVRPACGFGDPQLWRELSTLFATSCACPRGGDQKGS